jgi:hypothetical protein
MSGRTIGRPPLKIPISFNKYYAMWRTEEITAIDFAELLYVSLSTSYRYIIEYEASGFKIADYKPACYIDVNIAFKS